MISSRVPVEEAVIRAARHDLNLRPCGPLHRGMICSSSLCFVGLYDLCHALAILDGRPREDTLPTGTFFVRGGYE